MITYRFGVSLGSTIKLNVIDRFLNSYGATVSTSAPYVHVLVNGRCTVTLLDLLLVAFPSHSPRRDRFSQQGEASS